MLVGVLSWIAMLMVFVTRMYTSMYDEIEDFIFKWSSKGLVLPIHVGMCVSAVLIPEDYSPLQKLDYFKADPLLSPSWWLWIGPITFFLSAQSGQDELIVYLTALITTAIGSALSYNLIEEYLTMNVLIPGIESAETPPSLGSPGQEQNQHREYPKVFLGRWAPSANH